MFRTTLRSAARRDRKLLFAALFLLTPSGMGVGQQQVNNRPPQLQSVPPVPSAQPAPPDANELTRRFQLHDSTRNHAAAIADLDLLIELASKPNPASPADNTAIARWHNLRGAARFKNGDVSGSIADFDEAIRLQPAIEQGHWQRGISYYYDEKYQLGAQQFEQYQTYDAADVENVVWRFLCQAQAGGRTPAAIAAARDNMLPLGGPDQRVPMTQIDALFRGSGSAEAVFAAAEQGHPSPTVLQQHRFYAHLYVGLFYEATNDPTTAREHLLAADRLKIEHFMWDVAHVHAQRIRDKHNEAEREQAE